jgi:hypothetical protein
MDLNFFKLFTVLHFITGKQNLHYITLNFIFQIGGKKLPKSETLYYI